MSFCCQGELSVLSATFQSCPSLLQQELVFFVCVVFSCPGNEYTATTLLMETSGYTPSVVLLGCHGDDATDELGIDPRNEGTRVFFF